MAVFALLTQFLDDQLPPGSVGGVRQIGEGDEWRLKPSELVGLDRAVLAVRRASGAGRHLARELCGRMGVSDPEIPRSPDRTPLWPEGIVGSIAHDSSWAAAVIADATRLGGVGIDIEVPRPLSAEVVRLIGSSEETAAFSGITFGHTVLFSVKEAVFKAVYPRDRVFLEFRDVVVDRTSGTATTRYGRTVQWRANAEPRVLTVAWW